MPVFKKIPRWVLRMCGMDFFILVRFRFGFREKKNSDSVQNEFGCFGSKTRFGLDITVIYYSRRPNSKYYSNSG